MIWILFVNLLFIIYYLTYLLLNHTPTTTTKIMMVYPPPHPPSPTILHVYPWIHVNKKNAVSLLRKEPYLKINQLYISYWLLGNSVGDHIWKWSRYWPFRIHITETQWALGVRWLFLSAIQWFTAGIYKQREQVLPYYSYLPSNSTHMDSISRYLSTS